MNKWSVSWVVAALLFAPFSGDAADDLLARADAAWAGRDNKAQTLIAIQLYEQYAAKNPADAAVRVKLAHATCWAFEQDPEMGKYRILELMEKGIKACHEVLARNEDNPEANYWLMWNMAGKTLMKGVFSGFAFKEALVATIMVSKRDVGYQYGGVYCYWALVINSLPSLLGRFFHFSNDDAIWLYQRAVRIEPRYLRNHFFLGATYELSDQKDKAQAQYQFCLDQSDDALPEAIPENKLYKKAAQEAMAKL